MKYTLGIDYGTNSVRCVVVEAAIGMEIASSVWDYQSGKDGILLDRSDHNVARQNPADYVNGFRICVQQALSSAKDSVAGFDSCDVIGIGVDTTGSTPLPVDKNCKPISSREEFADNLNAMAWLWKDHTGYAEAEEITELAKSKRPEYLSICGGTYSSEWFFSKVLHCLRVDREVFDAAYTWLECCDYIPAVLCGIDNADDVVRGRCACGHKAMFNDVWGGFPCSEFLEELDPAMGRLRATLPDETAAIDVPAGNLCKQWADELGLCEGIPVAAGALDAHMGAIGSGVGRGKLVKIIGTSACDIMVGDKDGEQLDIPGLCGIVDSSVLPGCWGIEAGQSAVGDIFNWFVDVISPGGQEAGSHESLTEDAAKLLPGQSGLLALDWNNGNRTVLVDQRLTGLLVGQTLHTTPGEIYRALIEATAFGALTIINRLDEYGVRIDEIIACGGISEKNQMLLQIYSDVTGRVMKIAGSTQTCALGSAIAAAVVAGETAGGHASIEDAQAAMCPQPCTIIEPNATNTRIYSQLYDLYAKLHDAFGVKGSGVELYDVMKRLLEIKDDVSREK